MLWHTGPACGMDWHGSARWQPRSRTPRGRAPAGSRCPRGSGSRARLPVPAVLRLPCPAPGARRAPAPVPGSRGGRGCGGSAPAQGSPRLQRPGARQPQPLPVQVGVPRSAASPVPQGCTCTGLSPPARLSALLQRRSGTGVTRRILAQETSMLEYCHHQFIIQQYLMLQRLEQLFLP
ncbi:transmembrane protein 100 isoform X1 [Pyrgilauda ruficollis]|uniref:transmembrane protein 100 isoform X1 n=1 Tax=Pyrgilauda ruficollis TaxID=221976 RepID=UPI001B887012|nr:transmembrane protein 100 isoform X1 [Pyrgilauda ruficollis]